MLHADNERRRSEVVAVVNSSVTLHSDLNDVKTWQFVRYRSADLRDIYNDSR